MARRRFLIIGVALTAALCARAAEAEIRIATASPMSGDHSWAGEQYERGAGMAVADLNARGGVLGQKIKLIVGDDFCDPDQAVALARKFVSDGVVFVAGHLCSHSSIAAAKVYEEANILDDLPGLVEREADRRRWSKRVSGGRPGRPAGGDGRRLPCRTLGDKEVAILDDGTTFGAGVANGVRRRLRERGVNVTVDETITPGAAEYSALVSKMQAAGVDVYFLGGLQREIGLVFREAHDRGYDLRLVSSSGAPVRKLSAARRAGARRHGHGGQRRQAGEAPGGGGRGAISCSGLRAAGTRTLCLRCGSGLGPGGGRPRAH